MLVNAIRYPTVNYLKRESVRKSYKPLIELVAVVNRAYDDDFRLSLQTKSGALDYGKGDEARSIARAARKALRLLAEQDREPWKESRKDRASRTRRPTLDIDAVIRLYIDPDGRIQSGGDFFLACFLPALEGKEVHRLRICPECDRLFVAIRSDQPSCKECNNLYWAHKLRGKPKREKRS